MGEKLIYICKEGKVLGRRGRGSKRVGGGDSDAEEEDGRTISVVCGPDGKYELPNEWPRCV